MFQRTNSSQTAIRRDVIRWAKRIVENPFYIGDTETTGLSKTDQVVEKTVINQDGDIVFQSRFYSEVPMSAGATQANGIKTEDLANCPIFGEKYEELLHALYGVPDAPILWYNKGFDIRMLRQTIGYAARLMGIEDMHMPEPPIGVALLEKWGRPTLSVVGDLEHRSQCLMLKYARFNGDKRQNGEYQSVSLVNACRKEMIDVRGQHSSEGDTRMSLLLLKRMAQQDEDGDDD